MIQILKVARLVTIGLVIVEAMTVVFEHVGPLTLSRIILPVMDSFSPPYHASVTLWFSLGTPVSPSLKLTATI
jgi:hypothetical protein